MLSGTWNDVRYAARTLARSPGFAAAAIGTIALCIGVNTAIFSLLNGVALRSLPVPDADGVIAIHQVFDGVERNVHGTESMFSTAEYEVYRGQARTLAGISASVQPWVVTLGSAAPREVRATLVSCNYFDVLQRLPRIGRSLGVGDCGGGATPVAVLSHDLWSREFAADRAVVGQTVILNRQPFTVAGIAPEGFRGVDLQQTDLFVPLTASALLRRDRDFYNDEKLSWLNLLARPNDGESLEQVRAELGVIASQIDQRQPGRETRLIVERARLLGFPEARLVVLGAGAVVMTAFAMVLLIGCANVANLLLARATGRSREIAMRLSLGATRRRLVRQFLTESILLALVGGALGTLLAVWSSQALLAFALSALASQPEVSQLAIDPSPDARVLAFALTLAIATGILFGLAPALHASKQDLHTAAKQEARAGGGRLRGVLLGSQVAMCLVLMICAGLLLRGLYVAQAVDPGFRYDGITVVSFDLVGAGYDQQRATEFQRTLLERVRALPGVEGAAQVGMTPLTPGNRESIFALPGEDPFRRIGLNNVSPEYFSLLEIPIVRGRTFSIAELEDNSTAVIVTEATAARLWPGEDPLGRTFVLAVGENQVVTLEVVGVAKDANITTVGEITTSYAYLPAAPRAQPMLQLVVASALDPSAIVAPVRELVAELDPALAPRIVPLEDNLAFWQASARVVSTLSGALGALALALAAVGLYGVVSYTVGRRAREIGIRVALGAARRNVVALILRQTMRPVVIGAAIGLVASVMVSRVLASILFGVSPLDPLALGGATLFVLAVALGAGALPARRAARVDPMAALHHD
jgi:predicted permease